MTRGALHLLVILLVQSHHRLPGEVKGEGGREQRQQPDLHHRVVQDLVLACLRLLGISILELSSDSTVPRGDRDAFCQNRARLKYNMRADKGQGSVDKRGRSGTYVPACLRIDAGESREHIDVRHLDLVEKKKAIVHRVVPEFGPNIANMHILQWLVRL